MSDHTLRRSAGRLLPILLLVLAAPAALAQGGPGSEAFVRRSLDVERRLLREDLGEYARARQQATDTQRRLDELANTIDQVADQDPAESPAARTNIARFGDQLEEALRAHDAATARTERALDRVQTHLQRLRTLVEMLQSGRLPGVDQVLSGTWRLSLGGSVGRETLGGTARMVQDGTLVYGDYQLEDDRRGSFTGTFVGGRVRLELVDVRSGFFGILEGRVDGAQGRIEGFWRPTELAGGGPGGGGWAATKVGGTQ